ncbi:hypothetical protein ACFL6U_33080 [Planctomycetota bacterium]
MMEDKRHIPHRGFTSRRDFIKETAFFTAMLTSPVIATGPWSGRKVTVFVLADASDRTLSQLPIRWAVGELQNVLQVRGLKVAVKYNLEDLHEYGERIIITPYTSTWARRISARDQLPIPTVAESLALVPGRIESKPVVMATGPDVRGLVYAMLELADRITYAGDPVALLQGIVPSVEQPANSIRSMTRLFVSDIEDKPWFYDKGFWQKYLSMLVAQRFNRFSLTLGLGYDAPKRVVDSYFIFAYPYLVTVPVSKAIWICSKLIPLACKSISTRRPQLATP